MKVKTLEEGRWLPIVSFFFHGRMFCQSLSRKIMRPYRLKVIAWLAAWWEAQFHLGDCRSEIVIVDLLPAERFILRSKDWPGQGLQEWWECRKCETIRTWDGFFEPKWKLSKRPCQPCQLDGGRL